MNGVARGGGSLPHSAPCTLARACSWQPPAVVKLTTAPSAVTQQAVASVPDRLSPQDRPGRFDRQLSPLAVRVSQPASSASTQPCMPAVGAVVQVSSQLVSPRKSQAIRTASPSRPSVVCQSQLSARSIGHGEADVGPSAAHPSASTAPYQAQLSARFHDNAVSGVKTTQHSMAAIPYQTPRIVQSVGCREGHPSANLAHAPMQVGQEVGKLGLERSLDCSYRCEVSVLKATFPPFLDALDFRSSLGFLSLVRESSEVASPFPLAFSVPSQDALEDNLLHVCIVPRELGGRVTTEFETYLSLSSLAARADLGQRRVITLGMAPSGSGASPRAVCRHCIGADSASGMAETHTPRVSVACLVSRCSPPAGEVKDDAHVETFFKVETKLDSKLPGQSPVRALASKPSLAPTVPVATSAGEVELGPQENASLREDLAKAQNELRMQQTLMKFQEKRLRSFEAQSGAALAQEHLATARSTGMQVQLERLAATAQQQQLEIADLNNQLRAYRARELQAQAQAQDPVQAQVQATACARMQDEIEARDRRVSELEIALQDRDRQLDMIPDAVDMILRSPRPLLGDIEPAGAGSLQSARVVSARGPRTAMGAHVEVGDDFEDSWARASSAVGQKGVPLEVER